MLCKGQPASNEDDEGGLTTRLGFFCNTPGTFGLHLSTVAALPMFIRLGPRLKASIAVATTGIAVVARILFFVHHYSITLFPLAQG